MRIWPLQIQYWPKDEIALAVDNNDWQEFRKSLKGLPTELKLSKLYWYRHEEGRGDDTGVVHCRVDNYLNALKRGGQLNHSNEVQR